MDLKYKLVLCYTGEIIIESNNIHDIIKRLFELEKKDYHDYLDYCQKCVDNFEDPTIDERPGDYYPTYYIELRDSDESYDITNYNVLLRRINEEDLH